MFPLARTAVSLTARRLQTTVSRQTHHKAGPNFHDKYGNIILLSGIVFCTSIWSYVITQTGITWNLSPVGRITPKEWNKEE